MPSLYPSLSLQERAIKGTLIHGIILTQPSDATHFIYATHENGDAVLYIEGEDKFRIQTPWPTSVSFDAETFYALNFDTILRYANQWLFYGELPEAPFFFVPEED